MNFKHSKKIDLSDFRKHFIFLKELQLIYRQTNRIA